MVSFAEFIDGALVHLKNVVRPRREVIYHRWKSIKGGDQVQIQNLP